MTGLVAILRARLRTLRGGSGAVGDAAWGDESDALVLALGVAARSDDGLLAPQVEAAAAPLLAAYREAMTRLEPAAETAARASGPVPRVVLHGARPRPADRRELDVRRRARDRAPVPGRPAERPSGARWRWSGIRTAAAMSGVACAVVLMAGATAAAPPATPLYELRVAWEELVLPSAPGARLDAEVVRLDRRLAEAEAATTAGDPHAEAAALDVYVQIGRDALEIAPVGSAERTRLLQRLAAQVQVLERLRERPGAGPDVAGALQAATMLELHLRREAGSGGSTGASPGMPAGGGAGAAGSASRMGGAVASGAPTGTPGGSAGGRRPGPGGAAAPATGTPGISGTAGPVETPGSRVSPVVGTSPSASPSQGAGGGRGSPTTSPTTSPTGPRQTQPPRQVPAPTASPQPGGNPAPTASPQSGGNPAPTASPQPGGTTGGRVPAAVSTPGAGSSSPDGTGSPDGTDSPGPGGGGGTIGGAGGGAGG